MLNRWQTIFVRGETNKGINGIPILPPEGQNRRRSEMSEFMIKNPAKDRRTQKRYTMIMKKTINRKLRAFIPQHISNKIVLAVLKILSKLCCVPQSVISSNAAHNSKMLLNRNLYNADCYIENQSQWSAVKFGTKYSMSYSGCEIIAVHNALRALGKGLSVQCMVNLISCFEQD